MAEAFIGFGSNMGDRRENCSIGIRKIEKRHTILSLSAAYQTEPWGNKDQNWFLNGAVKISTKLTPTELLDYLKTIEEGMGRKEGIRWGSRPIDLDILFYEKEVINLPNLVIPHPLVHKRRFVLAPLV
ncbi:MAG: 2-amino-4-hydroxy-6-hydroxymethyldihydropteridine diphosphokinase, partial [bacterium]|nr:2-amino-4-hydroxy-6-hydroxymethyldihydropteridine diphosphokinase [bacterium]